MGNYKSRPGNSCSEEHLKKVTELQTMVRMKIMADLTLIEPGQMTELQVRRGRVVMIISWVLQEVGGRDDHNQGVEVVDGDDDHLLGVEER